MYLRSSPSPAEFRFEDSTFTSLVGLALAPRILSSTPSQGESQCTIQPAGETWVMKYLNNCNKFS